MNDTNKPVITPIGRQTWIVGKDFKVEVPISNHPDRAWTGGELYGHGLSSWDKNKGVLTITGHADKEKSGHVVVYAEKDGDKVKHTIYYDAVLSPNPMEKYEINPENIPADLEPDEKITLWRYMSFGSLCEILMNDHIPLISIRNFSDKSEGAILREILSKLPGVYVDQIEYAIQKYFESVYISSWHISENENAAMWDRYTHGGEGVVIKTNAKLLLDCIPQQSFVPGTQRGWVMPAPPKIKEDAIKHGRTVIKKIEYIDNSPSDFEMRKEYVYNGYNKMCFFYKLEDFEDESEVRILTSGFQNQYGYAMLDPKSFQRRSTGEDPISFENSLSVKIGSANKLIQQIVISPHAHNKFIETVKQIINHINTHRASLGSELIQRDVVESRKKEWV